MADAPTVRSAVSLASADVSLFGELTEDRARDLVDQLRSLDADGETALVEITTIGGDAALARRLVLELGLARGRLNRRLVFIGKTYVQSAGVTLMSAFPKADRYLSSDCELLIHCRQLEQSLEISGPMRSSLSRVRALLSEMENGLKLERENFERLIEGSDISTEELLGKALCNWYLTAEEACRRGLVADVLDWSSKPAGTQPT